MIFPGCYGLRTLGERRRWEAGRVGELSHADVCHGPTPPVGDLLLPLWVHALPDDRSRYVLGLRVLDHEREASMLARMLEAIPRYGAPARLYLDNGTRHRGEALDAFCGGLAIALFHASPYDVEARRRMERFWRPLRDGYLSPISKQDSLHDV